jgi:hypothetical protein
MFRRGVVDLFVILVVAALTLVVVHVSSEHDRLKRQIVEESW